VFLSLVYAYILKYLILPVKRVVANLDQARGTPPILFRKSKSLLEKEYNNLARDSLLMRINQKLKDFLSASTNLDQSRIFSELPGFISRLFHFDEVGFFRLKRKAKTSSILWIFMAWSLTKIPAW